MALNGLSQINVELTSRCNKSCSFCGHQSLKYNPTLEEGDIEWSLFSKIVDQLPQGIIVQLHRDGEPTMYHSLSHILDKLFHFVSSIVTNGKLLVLRANTIIGHCTTLTISVFRGDPDGPEQFEIVRQFLSIKGERPPMVNVKIVGSLEPEREAAYGSLGVPIIRRLLHVPAGDTEYVKRNPTVPEVGICLDMLSHPSVDWKGNLHICNRLDPHDESVLGNLNHSTLDELWNSPKRMEWLKAHKRGRRDQASKLCHDCLFWGIPSD